MESLPQVEGSKMLNAGSVQPVKSPVSKPPFTIRSARAGAFGASAHAAAIAATKHFVLIEQAPRVNLTVASLPEWASVKHELFFGFDAANSLPGTRCGESPRTRSDATAA